MVNFDYDCSGWATKANVQCYDGLVIAQDAFKECSGKVRPMVYNHDHNSIDNVLGHCLLENRPGGMYCYAKFNDTPTGQTAKQCVENGDLNAFSIYANGLTKVGNVVKHGIIQEVSLVLAGCNPGAMIDEVIKHSADEDYEGGEAFIVSDTALSITHGMDPDGNPLEDISHSADSGDAVTGDKVTQEEAKMVDEKNVNKEETVEDVFNTLTEKQKNVVYAIIGSAMPDENGDETDGEEDDTVKHNAFDKDTNQTVLKHSIEDINQVVKTAKSHGTMKAAFEDAGMTGDELTHSIDNIDYLFPEDHLLDTPPRIIDKPDDWVSVVMGAVHHIPFSRFKSMFADLTEEDARAKGYIKGNFKKEQVFSLLKRSTTPTTVYKKQKMDRDDVADITGFDVIAWLKQEMRVKLNEELARAYLIGDGRLSSSDDKINEGNIRPIYSDDDLFTIKVQVETAAGDDTATKLDKMMTAVLKARKNYKGAGNPTFYTTEDTLTDLLLLKDKIGHRLYKNEAEVAQALRVKEIVTVPQMEGMTGKLGGEFIGIIVNLTDYTVGADKGGAVNMFDDFDIDYNQQKYLIETRCSGAMTTPFGAMAIEYKVA